jgi:hypothetical protein
VRALNRGDEALTVGRGEGGPRAKKDDVKKHGGVPCRLLRNPAPASHPSAGARERHR